VLEERLERGLKEAQLKLNEPDLSFDSAEESCTGGDGLLVPGGFDKRDDGDDETEAPTDIDPVICVLEENSSTREPEAEECLGSGLETVLGESESKRCGGVMLA